MKKNALVLGVLLSLTAISAIVYSCQKTEVPRPLAGNLVNPDKIQMSADDRNGEDCTDTCRTNGTIELLGMVPANAQYFLDVVSTDLCERRNPTIPGVSYCAVGSFTNVCPPIPGSGLLTRCLLPGQNAPIHWCPNRRYWLVAQNGDHNYPFTSLVFRITYGTTVWTINVNNASDPIGPFQSPNCEGYLQDCGVSIGGDH